MVAPICEVIWDSQAELRSPGVQITQKSWLELSWGFSRLLGEWTMETMEQESWGSPRDWLKGQVMECQLDGDNRERWVQILALTLSLTVTLGKLPHISRLQFLPTYKWGCWLIWLTSLPLLQFCGSGCKTASTLWPWETLPIPSGHWEQTTFTTPEKQIPFMLPDHWCNSFIFSWKYEKCSGSFS